MTMPPKPRRPRRPSSPTSPRRRRRRCSLSVLVEIGLVDRYARVESPLGPLVVAWNGRGVSTVDIAADDAAFEARHLATTGRGRSVRAAGLPAWSAIARRLDGDRRVRIPLDLRGHSPFEQDVWRKASDPKSGEVRPHMDAAEIVEGPCAVGTALGHNPVPLIVPCHRVVRPTDRWPVLARWTRKQAVDLSVGRGPRPGRHGGRGAARRAPPRLRLDPHRAGRPAARAATCWSATGGRSGRWPRRRRLPPARSPPCDRRRLAAARRPSRLCCDLGPPDGANPERDAPDRAAIWVGLAILYGVWGSTYLGHRRRGGHHATVPDGVAPVLGWPAAAARLGRLAPPR